MEEVLAKYFSGNLTEEERDKVESWRSENEENASEFYQYKQVWNDSNVPEVDIKSALSSVLNNIENTEVDNVVAIDSVAQKSQNSWTAYLKYAAIVVLAAGLTFTYFSTDIFVPGIETIATTSDVQEVNLPDGSVVTLHRNSTLTYGPEFNTSDRQVTLSGKAFFDVKRDENRPFIVSTANSEVEVLGTSFMVESEAGVERTEVFVVTGKVGVTNKSTNLVAENLKVELTPGQLVNVTENRSEFLVKNTEELNFLSWKTGMLSFKNERLEDVIGLLQDVYGVSVEISDNNINNCKLTANFDQDSVEEILEIIAATYGFEIKKTGNDKFRLTGSGCIDVN